MEARYNCEQSESHPVRAGPTRSPQPHRILLETPRLQQRPAPSLNKTAGSFRRRHCLSECGAVAKNAGRSLVIYVMINRQVFTNPGSPFSSLRCKTRCRKSGGCRKSERVQFPTYRQSVQVDSRATFSRNSSNLRLSHTPHPQRCCGRKRPSSSETQ
jgi:hypothetical protein